MARGKPGKSIPIKERDDSDLRVLVVIDSRYHWPIHSHNALELILAVDGKGTVYYDDVGYDTKAGDLWVYNQGAVHTEVSDEAHPLRWMALTITNVRIRGMEENHILPAGKSPVLFTGDYFTMFYSLFSYINNHQDAAYADCTRQIGEVGRLILSLTQELIAQSEEYVPQKREQSELVRQLTEYLDRYYTEDVCLEDLEKMFSFSKYYLAHRFKEETEHTINEYIIKRRIGEAAILLTYTDLPVAEVGAKVGYSAVSNFSTAFRKYIGTSPRKYRNILQKNAAQK